MMSEHISSKFAQIALRSDECTENGSSDVTARTNAEDSNRSNPWKPVHAGENNILEAEAWPEPSVPGEQRRATGNRQPEEKIKRKIKWQNYDVEQSAPGFSRGRARGAYSTHYAPAVSPLRRGNFRGRGSFDNTRNPRVNGYFSRYSARPAPRMPFDQDERFADSHSDGANSGNPVPSKHPNADSKATNSHENGAQPNHPEPVVNVCTQSAVVEGSKPQSTSKRSYRDRPFVQTITSDGAVNTSYEAGPLGRVRRSYMRQNPAFTGDIENSADSNGVIAPAAITPLIPFHSVAPIAYIIPGAPAVGNPLWGTSLQLAQGCAPPLVPAPPTSHIGVNQQSISPSSRVIDEVPPTGRIEEGGTFGHPPPFNPSKAVGGDVMAELIDATQMISYINEIGWQNVVFPRQLRSHPPIASVLANLGAPGFEAGSSGESKSDDTRQTEKIPKMEDVVVINDQIFFVPRNANKTKFLKFTSKLDYIRHHVEYYFSEANLSRDSHLVSILDANQRVCPITDLLQFNRLRWVATSQAELLDAVSRSHQLAITFSPDHCPFGVRRVESPSVQQPSTSDVPQRPSDKLHEFPNGFDKVESTANSLIYSASPSEAVQQPTSVQADNSAAPLMDQGGRAMSNQIHQAMFANPTSRIDSAAYSTMSSASQPASYVSPSDQPTAFSQLAYYSQQAALLTSNATVPPVSTSLATNLQPEMTPALMPGFYRVAAPAQFGAYLNQLPGPSTFPSPTSSGLLLQLLPSGQPALAGGYQQVSPLLSRSTVGSINPAGVWVPVNPGNGNASQPGPNPVNPAFQPLLNIHHNLANIPVANAAGYAAVLPSMPTFPFHLPVQNIETIYPGHDARMHDDHIQQAFRHMKPAVPNNLTSNDGTSNYFPLYNNRSSTAPPTFTDSCSQSTRTTPKKVS